MYPTECHFEISCHYIHCLWKWKLPVIFRPVKKGDIRCDIVYILPRTRARVSQRPNGEWETWRRRGRGAGCGLLGLSPWTFWHLYMAYKIVETPLPVIWFSISGRKPFGSWVNFKESDIGRRMVARKKFGNSKLDIFFCLFHMAFGEQRVRGPAIPWCSHVTITTVDDDVV